MRKGVGTHQSIGVGTTSQTVRLCNSAATPPIGNGNQYETNR